MKFSANLVPDPRMIAITAIVASVVSVGSYWAVPSVLRVDGMGVWVDVPPVTHAREAYVPLRAIGDTLGADVAFDAKTGFIEIVHGKDTLRLRAGDRHAMLDGKAIVLAHAPFTVRGRVMVSRDVIARAFDSRVHYDPVTAKIDVITPHLVEAGAQQGP